MPSRTLAATIQPQLGATAISSGTGSATAQPAISSRRRPTRCGERAGAEVGERLGEPERDDERQHRRAGSQAEVLAPDQRQRRALEADHRADERVDGDQQRELRGVLAQPEPDRRGAHATSASGRPARLAATIAACCSGAGGMSWSSACDERVLGVELQRAVVAALEADRRDRVGRQAAAADRAGVVRRVQHEVVGQRQQPLGQRAVQRARHLLDGVLAVGVQVGAAGVADQQRVAGQHEPRLVAARVVGDEVGVMRERVAGRGDRLHLGVAELDDLAVGERVMLELDAGALRQIRASRRCARRARAARRRGRPARACRTPRRSATPCALGERDVLVDEVDVRVDDRELRCASCSRAGRRRTRSRR